MNGFWNFNISKDVTNTGLNDAGIETFRDDIFKSLTKEICQNSLDARMDKNKVVKVEFNSFILSKSDFPDRLSLNEVLSNQISYWSKVQKNDKTPIRFFEHSKSVLNRSNITFLRISDFNTKGLTESDKKYGGNWNNLVKSNFVSDKPGSAGGSFGIGKSASYTVSECRTVFYATKDITGLEAFQGVSKLATYEDENGDRHASTGYYGQEENTHIPNCISLDPSFIREESGTDVYISAFKKTANWQEMIIISVLNNFLISLFDRRLSVIVNKKNKLNLNNVRETLKKYDSNKYLDSNTKDYFRVKIDERTQVFTLSMFENDDVELSILFDKNLNRKVAIVRQNGMKIFDKDRISTAASFSGICILKGDKVNEFFKKLENPAHNGWRFEGVENEEAAKKQKEKLFRFIIDTVMEIINKQNSEEIDVEGLNEFIPDFLEDEDSDRKKTETISDEIAIPLKVKKHSISEKVIKADKPEEPDGDTPGADGYEDPEGDDETSQPGDGQGGDGGNKGEENGLKASEGEGNLKLLRSSKIKPLKIRARKDGSYTEITLLTDANYELVELDINVSGEQNKLNYEIINVESNDVVVNLIDGRIILKDIRKELPVSVRFNDIENKPYAMEVNVYEIETK